MGVVTAFVRRNLRLFFRDRSAVFFSLLAAISLFALYTLFLGELQTSDLRRSFPTATVPEIEAFVDSWMFAGIVSMTAITTGLGALGVLVDDAASGRFRDFLVSPVRPGQLVLGYFLSALTVALMMSFVVLAISLVFLGAVDGVMLSPESLVRVAGLIVVISGAFSAMSAFVTSFVRSPGAFAALSTVIGTTLGFLAGAYIPVGSLAQNVQPVVSALPFAQASMLMRREFATETLDVVVAGAPEARDPLRAYFGLDSPLGEWTITAPSVITVLVVLTIVFTALGALRIRTRVGRVHSPSPLPLRRRPGAGPGPLRRWTRPRRAGRPRGHSSSPGRARAG